MFIRIMLITGSVVFLLALIMYAHMSQTNHPPLSLKPGGTSTLSHGGPSTGGSDRRGNGLGNQDDDGRAR